MARIVTLGEMFDYIAQHPGCNTGYLQKHFDLPYTTIRHAIKQMEIHRYLLGYCDTNPEFCTSRARQGLFAMRYPDGRWARRPKGLPPHA